MVSELLGLDTDGLIVPRIDDGTPTALLRGSPKLLLMVPLIVLAVTLTRPG